MDLGYTLAKAVVQGLTEFLPVSSSAHLVLTNTLFDILGQPVPNHVEAEVFDVMLHMGTLAAVLVYFWGDLQAIFRSIVSPPVPQATKTTPILPAANIPKYIIITTFLTCAFIGTFLIGSKVLFAQLGWATDQVSDLSDFYRANPVFVGGHLILTGLTLFFIEHRASQQITAPTFGTKNAMLVGLFQGMAGVFRGFSRSGSCISGAMLAGADRATAARYAFLASIPTFILAGSYEGLKVLKLGVTDAMDWPMMALGIVVTSVVGYFCIKGFITYVGKNSLRGFATYCILAGLLSGYLGLGVSEMFAPQHTDAQSSVTTPIAAPKAPSLPCTKAPTDQSPLNNAGTCMLHPSS